MKEHDSTPKEVLVTPRSMKCFKHFNATERQPFEGYNIQSTPVPKDQIKKIKQGNWVTLVDKNGVQSENFLDGLRIQRDPEKYPLPEGHFIIEMKEPLGIALQNKKVGDQIAYQDKSGLKKVTVKAIRPYSQVGDEFFPKKAKVVEKTKRNFSHPTPACT